MNSKIASDNVYEIRLYGEAVKNGTIVIDDYIEYLIGISNLCKNANSFLNPGTNLEVKIDSNIKKGSIINTLTMIIQGIGLFTNTQTPYKIEDILSMLGIIESYGTSLIKLLCLKKNNKIESVLELSDDKFKLTFSGEGNIQETYATVSKEVLSLYKHKQTRENLEKSVKILTKEGYEGIGFKQANSSAYHYIDKNISKYLSSNTSSDEIIDNLYEAIVEIENVPPTKLDNKWRFKEKTGDAYWAYIKDENFKNNVKQNGLLPPFLLKVIIRKSEKYDENNNLLKVDKEIIKVIEIFQNPIQKNLYN